MTTFKGITDFDGPQPYNCDLEAPDVVLYPRIPYGVKARAIVPVVAQVIERDAPIYGAKPLRIIL